MLILEQWPRQIAPAARGTLASNFRVLRLDQPAGQPSQLSWTTPAQVVSRLAWGASTQLPSFPQHRLPWASASALLCVSVVLWVLCQVRVPRTGPGLCRELAAKATGQEGGEP